MKKRIIIIGVILLTICLITTLIGTFASDSTVASTDNTHTITLTGSTGEITVPAGTSKTALYQITNTNKGVVKYGVAYSGDNITVKVYNDTIDPETGLIDYGENKFVKLYIQNTGETESTASIKTVLGYEFGGELESIVPSGYTLVTEVYTPPKSVNLLTYITNLYLNNKNTDLVTNNGISYGYASSVGLMNDRQGTMDVGEDEGNIRYYGADPNNYIYFNCETYPETNCETWRIIGKFDNNVKLIKNTIIGELAWDQDKNIDSSLTTYSTNWEEASLNKLLNNEYYNGDTAGIVTYYSFPDGTTETVLNMNEIGIKNNQTRSMIKKSTWYLGSPSPGEEVYANDVYNIERTDSPETVYNGNPYTTEANIGLVSVSDIGYSADLTSCKYDINSYYSDVTNCINSIWIGSNAGHTFWTIIPALNSNIEVAWVYEPGYGFAHGIVPYQMKVLPVLYLSENVKIIEGNTGTSADPYRISVS